MNADYKVEFRETQNGVIPTVWIGVQGFDLVERFADGKATAQHQAEWFAKMFKRATKSKRRGKR